jgi:hypothetical protein
MLRRASSVSASTISAVANPAAARGACHVELRKLVVLQHEEADRFAGRSDEPIGQRRREPRAKTRNRARLHDFGRRESAMRIVPALVPEPGEVIEVVCAGGSDGHAAQPAVCR